MKNIILSGKDVRKTFTQGGKEAQILLGIDVDIYEGDFTVIMGSSGAGKSTLLYALSGMDFARPYAGSGNRCVHRLQQRIRKQ